MLDELPATERASTGARALDDLPTLALLRQMNAEDARVAAAVARTLPAVARAVDGVAALVGAGGRLVLVGAGTSGRLAVIEAAELMPTFGVARGVVVAVMAGGADAMSDPIEGAEDDAAGGGAEMERLDVGPGDAVVGISASGRTPFVLGAVAEAARRGALTVGLCCDDPAPLSWAVAIAIHPLVGAEIIAGSTRLKAGTAQKLVLNMLTTATMVRLGRVHGNLMVDVQPTNAKLRRRAQRIVEHVTGRSGPAVEEALRASGWSARVAIVMLARSVNEGDARRLLASGASLDRLIAVTDEASEHA